MTNLDRISFFLLGVAIAVLLAWAMEANAEADGQYVGVHITVPFTFDAVGVQVVGRNENFELRAGLDSRGYFQAGAGVTTGEESTLSGGASYSSYHGQVVPYFAAAYGTGDWEAGVVDYGFDAATVYAFAGYKAGRTDKDDNPAPATKVSNTGGPVVSTDTGEDGDEDSTGDVPVTGGDDTDDSTGEPPVDTGNPGGGGSSGGGDQGNGDDSGDDGGDTDDRDDLGHGNHSGLGDGTNPGKGKGRDNSPNTGTENPNNANR